MGDRSGPPVLRSAATPCRTSHHHLRREGPPTVSVLTPTNRPRLLRWAAANVARLTYPRLEWVIALHGEGFNDDDVRRTLAAVRYPTKIVRVDGSLSLGEVRNATAAAAEGDLLATMDDDDLYGSGYVWNLVSAYMRRGRAVLVGMAIEHAYLMGDNRTVERRFGKADAYAHFVSGAAMMISAADLDRVGGWRAIPARVDSALIDDVVASGGLVYRARSKGVMRIRRSDADSHVSGFPRYFARPDRSLCGWRPSLAGIGEVPDGTVFPGYGTPLGHPP